MELIIHILMLFIVINCSFKLSFWKLWQTVIYSLIAGLFVAGTWQYAILQSKTQIADYLQNTEALQNMAIIITLESALCFGYCVAFLRGLYGKKNLCGSSFPCQLIHLYPRTTDHCQWENDLCRHRRGAQLESDYLVHRSVRCPVSHWICLEQAEMAFITT